MPDYRFAWFRFSDHTWHGDFHDRLSAAKASMIAQPNSDIAKTIAFSGYIMGEKKLDSRTIVRFDLLVGGPVPRRLDVIHSSV